jgi:hypothetical protein
MYLPCSKPVIELFQDGDPVFLSGTKIDNYLDRKGVKYKREKTFDRHQWFVEVLSKQEALDRENEYDEILNNS